MINEFMASLRSFRKRRAIASLRHELSLWGFDTSHLTDEQIDERVRDFGNIVRDAGFTIEQAAQGLRMMI